MSDDDDDRKLDTAGAEHDPVDPDEVAPTVLGDVISSTIERMDDRESPNRPTHNPLQAIVGSVLTRLATAQRQQEAAQAEPPSAPEPPRPTPAAFDVQTLIDDAVRAFVRTHLDVSSTGDTPRRVIVDGEYVARHGTELVPAILAHIAQAWIAVLGGTASPPPPSTGTEVDIEIDYDFSDIVRAALARNRDG